MHVLVVVEHRGEFWLCPRRPGGWAARQRLSLTAESRAERLRPAPDVTPAWLGIHGPADCEDSTQTGAEQRG